MSVDIKPYLQYLEKEKNIPKDEACALIAEAIKSSVEKSVLAGQNIEVIADPAFFEDGLGGFPGFERGLLAVAELGSFEGEGLFGFVDFCAAQIFKAADFIHRQFGEETQEAADIGIFPFVRQFAAIDPPWWSAQPLPSVQAWLAGWLAHPLFERAMRKLPEPAAAAERQ